MQLPSLNQTLRHLRQCALLSPDTFPWLDRAGLNPEQRVAFRVADCAQLREQGRIANRQLLQQVLPLILDLAGRDENGYLDSRAADLAPVEGIAARYCFAVNAPQVPTYRRTRS